LLAPSLSPARMTDTTSNGGNVLTVKLGREASGGVIRSENVDMSSDKQGERPCRRKSKGSCLKLI
jgi:hypothetical protein